MLLPESSWAVRLLVSKSPAEVSVSHLAADQVRERRKKQLLLLDYRVTLAEGVLVRVGQPQQSISHLSNACHGVNPPADYPPASQ